MLGVASTSGNTAEVYESTAKFLERDEEFKKNLKSALIMPAVIHVLGPILWGSGSLKPNRSRSKNTDAKRKDGSDCLQYVLLLDPLWAGSN